MLLGTESAKSLRKANNMKATVNVADQNVESIRPGRLSLDLPLNSTASEEIRAALVDTSENNQQVIPLQIESVANNKVNVLIPSVKCTKCEIVLNASAGERALTSLCGTTPVQTDIDLDDAETPAISPETQSPRSLTNSSEATAVGPGCARIQADTKYNPSIFWVLGILVLSLSLLRMQLAYRKTH